MLVIDEDIITIKCFLRNREHIISTNYCKIAACLKKVAWKGGLILLYEI